MRKIVIGMDAGFAGTDAWEFYEVPDGVTEEEMSDYAWQRGKEHAESYGVYPRCEYEGDPDIEDDELDSDSYSDNIEGWWEEYDPELHDMHSITGVPIWQKW